ncbi:hypothetical protein [Corallococcus terminator]|uniref:hypothetical protein n=1 Tax=Corallococcus terminator TaxID=2316733 RepID=UPI0011C357E8|nr:hypothetical protein [Corallococcus terminator]
MSTDRIPDDTLGEVDALILAGNTMAALKRVICRLGCSLGVALELVALRSGDLDEIHPARREERLWRRRSITPAAWRAQAVERLEQLTPPPQVLKALWDGDSGGWFLVMSAIVPVPSQEHPRFTSVHLVTMRASDGEPSAFSEPSSSWPEITVAKEIARIAQERWNTSLYFPSSDQPEDDDLRWWDELPSPSTDEG